ncbi:hypothetical protein IEU95_12235 [Hoyosella rhizosphaerae]|uniref:PH domain-containing protein n=1 Tax=Hoyosella rhizosphaerae TaxID=1755582 RepID=A0A916XD68_9ACTN|nr:hypothetical protein [Hoyosella rhizosphaerae]MBN4927603.1 hypothetical protein [Hoyosella rhizosphaerae]GGC63172.1 hypothetical protein GCM10011410_14490 [Hoyosella rhizosphaerae]
MTPSEPNSTVSWPSVWPVPQATTREKIIYAVLGILGVSMLITGAVGALNGKPTFLIYGGLLAILFGLGIVHFRHHTRPQFDRNDISIGTDRDGNPVTVLQRSPVLFNLRTAMMAVATLLFIVSAIDHYFDEGTEGIFGVIIYSIIALFFGWYLLSVATGSLQRGHVELSPTGIRFRGWSVEANLTWREIIAVYPEYEDRVRKVLVVGDPERTWQFDYTVKLWRIDRLTVVPMLDIDTRKFRLPPQLLRAIFAQYWENPSSRNELGTQRSLDRIHSLWDRSTR